MLLTTNYTDVEDFIRFDINKQRADKALITFDQATSSKCIKKLLSG